MANRFDSAIDRLSTRLKGSAGVIVTYCRGDASVELTASVGQTPYEQTDENGIVTRFELRDFLVDASDLVLEGVTILPKPGDQVRQVLGDTTHVYETMSLSGMPCYSSSGPSKERLRIHTKLLQILEG